MMYRSIRLRTTFADAAAGKRSTMVMRPPQQQRGRIPLRSSSTPASAGSACGSPTFCQACGAPLTSAIICLMRATFLTRGAGEEAVMADAVEAIGENVQQEAAHELVDGQRRWS